MGAFAAAVPYILTAVSTAATVYNSRETARKQDNALAAQINASSKKNKEADDRTRQLIDKTAASSPDAEKSKALGQYVAALNAGGSNATAGLTAQKGAVSDRYAQDARDASLGVSQYGADKANIFSTIDAAKRQRDDEGFDRGRAANDLLDIERRAKAQDFLLGLKTQGIRRNPWIDAGAGLLKGYAGSMGGGAGGGDGGLTWDSASASQRAPFFDSSLFGGGP